MPKKKISLTFIVDFIEICKKINLIFFWFKAFSLIVINL